MDSFSIIGPIMIGPSSSHTAGAARIGGVARRLLGEPAVRAHITLSGSFARTYRGHGTDRALVAGIMGMAPDDDRLRNSLELARTQGLAVKFTAQDIPDAHPNTVRIRLRGVHGARVEVEGASVGGGSVLITSIDGFPVHIDGERDVLVVVHRDVPGIVAAVSNTLSETGVNICTLSLSREEPGGTAVMTVGVDGPVGRELLARVSAIPLVNRCTLVSAQAFA